jgi:hypothetical protein
VQLTKTINKIMFMITIETYFIDFSSGLGVKVIRWSNLPAPLCFYSPPSKPCVASEWLVWFSCFPDKSSLVWIELMQFF